MSDIRSLGTAGRLKRALVASGLALATVSWLGVSAMPASSTTTCQFLPGGLVVFNPDETTDDNVWLRVDDSDGRLRINYNSSDYACTNNPSQTKQVTSITIGSDAASVYDVYLDLGFLQDNGGVDITAYAAGNNGDVGVYNTQDDPQGGLDISIRGGRDNIEVEYGDIHVDVFLDGDYWEYIGVAGTGADDSIVADLDAGSLSGGLFLMGDAEDLSSWLFASDSWGDDCESDQGQGDDTIDASGSTGWAELNGCDGDDVITGNSDDNEIYGGDGDDWVEDGRGDDYVEAEWMFAGATAQGQDDYHGESGVAIYDYSARTRSLLLHPDDLENSGENGEEDYLEEHLDAIWLLGGSGDDVVTSSDAPTEIWMQGAAGSNRLDCNGDWDDEVQVYADYEFSPSAVNVDLATGTATGWGTDRLIGCDRVFGSEYADTIAGNGNLNELIGLGGDDTIDGLGSMDYLRGNDGDDTLSGDDDDDYLQGDDGRDSLFGDAGDDIMGAQTQAGCDRIGMFEESRTRSTLDDPETGLDDGILDSFDYYEGPGTGGTEAGNDKFDGGSGDDYMCGGIGEDRVMLSSGTDVFDGGAGRNLVDASALESGVRIDLQLEEASWDGWNTYLQRTKDAVGSQYNDRITAATVGALDGNVGSKISGRGGNDEIIGFSGPDQLRGNADNDAIFAGSGNDKLRGGAGNDELWGQGGVDTGNGGAGSDVCKSVERATGCETVLSRQQLV